MMVCKRWLLHLQNLLSLDLTDQNSTIPSLSLLPPNLQTTTPIIVNFSDQLLLVVSTNCSRLRSLRFLASPVFRSSIVSLSTLYGFSSNDDFEAELGIERLCVSGIRSDDSSLGWVWRRCTKFKKLQLHSCEGIEVELRTCRSIVDRILLKLVENSDSLTSLLVYEVDMVFSDSLAIIAETCRNSIFDFALINCNVVERESGLLATLGYNLKQLKKLDLSYNEMLLDKEFVSMLISCYNLVDLKLRGCKGLTNLALTTMSEFGL
ncbi:hypothetical protein UlMin_039396 [Ulmus minor]